MSTAQQTQPELPPHAQVIQMATGHWLSKIIYTAVKLDIADRLADAPKCAAELAGPAGLHAPTLHRLMRTLAGFGILTEKEDKRFALTPMGESLKTGAPGSARSTILTFCGPTFVKAFDEIQHSLETGQTGFEKAFGMPIFDYFVEHPDEASMFSESMVGFHGGETHAVAAAYDFSQFETIVDVGGATGNMLSAVLARHKGPRGILFDMAHVVADAPAYLENTGVADRISIESGSFFESVPEGGDAYILSHIIHDWNEEQCLTILGNVRRAMKPDGKLLLVEFVLPEDDSPHLGKLADMIMLVIPGGQERTPAEYDELLAKAGFRMTRVVPTESPVSIVEAEIA
jgi:hypothetical protein